MNSSLAFNVLNSSNNYFVKDAQPPQSPYGYKQYMSKYNRNESSTDDISGVIGFEEKFVEYVDSDTVEEPEEIIQKTTIIREPSEKVVGFEIEPKVEENEVKVRLERTVPVNRKVLKRVPVVTYKTVEENEIVYEKVPEIKTFKVKSTGVVNNQMIEKAVLDAVRNNANEEVEFDEDIQEDFIPDMNVKLLVAKVNNALDYYTSNPSLYNDLRNGYKYVDFSNFPNMDDFGGLQVLDVNNNVKFFYDDTPSDYTVDGNKGNFLYSVLGFNDQLYGEEKYAMLFSLLKNYFNLNVDYEKDYQDYQGYDNMIASDLETVPEVNLERYAGTWYEIARLPVEFEKDPSNVTAEYTLNGDGTVTVKNSEIINGRTISIVGTATPVDETNSKLKIDFNQGFIGDYWIVQLDEQNYYTALVSSPNKQQAWILYREKNIPLEIAAYLFDWMEEHGYPVEKLLVTPQY